MSILTARQFETFGPGKYSDGDNLHLIVSPTGSRRFIYSPRVGTKRPEFGIKTDTLKAARLERDRMKGLLAQGLDPRSGKSLDAKSHALTFAEVAKRYIFETRGQWTDKTAQEWERTTTVDCAPIAAKTLDDIDVADIKNVLLPIFAESPDKARRVKMKIGTIYGYGADHELCSRDRRAPTEGKTILPAASKAANHHAALPYSEIPAAVAKLRTLPNIAARGLEFLIYTAARASEVAEAQWSEFDLDAALWTIPADRMKASRAHVVPLSPRAVQILRSQKEISTNQFAFPGQDKNEHIHPSSFLRCLTLTLKLDVTAHGIRSSFRDWAGDCTAYSRELAEEALAHQVGSAVERAYRRGSALEKRRAMMNDWGSYCEPADNVVRLPAKKA